MYQQVITIRDLLQSEWVIHVKHVYHKCNKKADWLANHFLVWAITTIILNTLLKALGLFLKATFVVLAILNYVMCKLRLLLDLINFLKVPIIPETSLVGLGNHCAIMALSSLARLVEIWFAAAFQKRS